MPAVNDIGFSNDIQSLIDEIRKSTLDSRDLHAKRGQRKTPVGDASPESMTVSKFQIRVLEFIQATEGKVMDMHNKIGDLTNKLQVCQEKNEKCTEEIVNLTAENKSLQKKLNSTETEARINKVVLSGPVIKIARNSTPHSLMQQARYHISNIYNFNFDECLVANCENISGRDLRNPKILLTFTNNFVKSALMDAVVKTNKRNGIGLNVNEYLSTQNANVLFHLRGVKKEFNNKIFSCFPRNGKVFYKCKANSRPKVVYTKEEVAVLRNELQLYGNLDRLTSATNRNSNSAMNLNDTGNDNMNLMNQSQSNRPTQNAPSYQHEIENQRE